MPRLRGTLARVFWPRVRTGRVRTARAYTGPKSSAIITAPGEKCGLAPTSRRRLVVHVGLPKTGSSTIRHALAALAPELRCQGVHVPVAGRSPRPDGSIRHANLLRALTGVDFKPEHGAWLELAEELRESNARQFVVSDEMLSRRSPSSSSRTHRPWTGAVWTLMRSPTSSTSAPRWSRDSWIGQDRILDALSSSGRPATSL